MKVRGEECNSEINANEIIFKNVNVVKVLKFVKVYREDDDSKAMHMLPCSWRINRDEK